MKVPKARKLKSGTWFIQLRLNGESISVTGDTQKECTDKALAIKSGIKAGMREVEKKEKQPKKLPTLENAVEAFIQNRSNVLSPSTINGYESIKRTRFQRFMPVSLSDIKDTDWQIACNEEARKVNAKTLKNSWAFVSSVLKENGIEPPKVKLPQVVPNERQWLEPEQIKTFVKAVHGTSVEIPALLALHSLRRSEILALKWENIDFKKRIIHVRGAAVLNENNKLVQKPQNKNATSTRDVAIMIDELYDALKEKKKPSGLVVTCCPTSIWANVNRICENEGLPRVGVHGLRHSFVSLAYHLGVQEKIVMSMGGWADYQTMRKIYTHIAKSDVENSAEKFKTFFQSKESVDKQNAN